MKALIPILATALVLALFAAAISGCNDTELPEVNFIGSSPPTGSNVSTGLDRVRLFFDCTPRSVTVNGMMARVENTTAVWEIQDWLDEDDITLAVEWLNQDGSEGKGAVIHYQSIYAPVSAPWVVDSNVYPGDKDVDPDRVNRSGITFRFNEDVRPGTIEIRPEGGKPLNWIAEWWGEAVTITPPEEGKLLHGKRYVIEITGVTSSATGVKEENVEILNFTLHFSTKE